MTDALVSRLCNRLCGGDAGWRLVVVTGVLLGVLPALDAQERLVPFVLLIVPAWYFYIVVVLFHFLHCPRKLNPGFVFGLEYAVRGRIARRFITRKAGEITAISLIAALSFAGVHIIGFGMTTLKDSLEFGALLSGLIIFCQVVLTLVLLLQWLSPQRHDPRSFWHFLGTRSARTSNRLKRHYIIAGFLGSMLLGSRSIILKRQLLYLMRGDLFVLGLYMAVALIVTIALTWFARHEAGLVVTIGITLAPLFVYSAMTDSMSDSAACALGSGHYPFTRRDFFMTNTVIALTVAAPFMLLYSVRCIFLTHATAWVMFVGISAFVCAMVTIALAMANRWQQPAWDGVSLGIVLFAVAGALVGAAVVTGGFLVPVVSMVILLWVFKNSFHAAR